MREEVTFFDFKILNLDNLNELKGVNIADYDLVNVFSQLSSGFWRTQKIIWRLEIKDSDSFSYILAKREKEKILSLSKKRNFKIVIKIPVDEKLFLQWLEIYKKVIGQKKRGIQRVDKNWLSEKKTKNQFSGGIFIFEEENLQGGSLFIEPIDEKNCLSVALTACQKNYYSPLLEYYFLKWGIEKKYKYLGYGKDINLYGMIYPPGLFEFKSRYGYKPQPFRKLPFVTTYFLNKDKFYNQEALFLYFKDIELRLALLSDRPKKELLTQRFAHANLSIDVFRFSEIVKKHREVLNSNR